MPPPHDPHRHDRHVPSSAINSFVRREAVDRILARWVPDAGDRRFVVRCLLEEGPAHHRGANYVLLALLASLLPDAAAPPAAGGPTAPVPLRLPPHLREAIDDRDFPLRMPTAPLERLAPRGSVAFQAMVDCLTDGPPQHALANAAMIAIIDGLIAARGTPEGESSPAP